MKRLLPVLFLVAIAFYAVYRLASRDIRVLGPIGRDGRAVKIEPIDGKTTLVHFWGTWCGPCRAELPSFVAFAEAHHDNLRYIAVADDPSFEKVDGFLREQNLTLNTTIDPKGTVLRAWKVSAVPTTFVLDSRGNVVNRYVGFTNWNDRFIEEQVMNAAR